jgi:hypothetical protein
MPVHCCGDPPTSSLESKHQVELEQGWWKCGEDGVEVEALHRPIQQGNDCHLDEDLEKVTYIYKNAI